jgi:hypothetical protein
VRGTGVVSLDVSQLTSALGDEEVERLSSKIKKSNRDSSIMLAAGSMGRNLTSYLI